MEPTGVLALQIKEKFGTLRYYVYGGDSYAHNAIRKAEDESYNTCEKCGSKENVETKGSWLKTLCNKCRGG